ncbi:ead/Ea22-like family protein [Escherichia coli]|nr:ead/Ea22-like family protein [Escherichia coli]
MSNINYQVLREAAENAKNLGGIKNYKRGEQAVAEFKSLITPHIVLALLEEREGNQQYIKRRDQENEDIALTVGKLRVELEGKDKRIADMEAREVVLPRAHDVHPLEPQSAKIFCEFHRSIVNRCADEIRKVGVKVSIKGN